MIIASLLGLAGGATADCLHVPKDDPSLKLDPAVVTALSNSKLDRVDLFRVMQVVAGYETDGCWAGATGNFDGQWLSVGVMQWNFGQGSLQPLLKAFREKYPDHPAFEKMIADLMPHYGSNLFDLSCRSEKIGERCQQFLRAHYVGGDSHLDAGLEKEIGDLFQFPAMRQVQIDYFARTLTTVLDDLSRVFQRREPGAWQVAWAMDLKTQQGRFPTDASIKRIRLAMAAESVQQRRDGLLAIIEWYEGLCGSGDVAGVQRDYRYNVTTWTRISSSGVLTQDREETVHFTYVVSRTARTDDGLYQADAFQRRATIAFGMGSVHGTHVELASFQ